MTTETAGHPRDPMAAGTASGVASGAAGSGADAIAIPPHPRPRQETDRSPMLHRQSGLPLLVQSELHVSAFKPHGIARDRMGHLEGRYALSDEIEGGVPGPQPRQREHAHQLMSRIGQQILVPQPE